MIIRLQITTPKVSINHQPTKFFVVSSHSFSYKQRKKLESKRKPRTEKMIGRAIAVHGGASVDKGGSRHLIFVWQNIQSNYIY